MAIDAIGTAVSTNSGAASNSIDLEGFLKLFITQLTYQDPLEPTKNEEFLAQMAQFSGLEQQRQTTERVTGILTMNSSSQSVSMLGKRIEVVEDGRSLSGTVTAVRFTQEGPLLTLQDSDGNSIPNIRLSQISLVRRQGG
ncbi:flagellar hook assembly protein FlgD [Teredinibacter franksiae]|jgi:Flagellar hook capping protein|uniref:flagellar hook assembly protein FlgD n=1 Tax=Teredinibacter franksiae TaxID=2761453 RepID=UPI0016233406|nr:flagellar hook capping FlgD N-terminal domain-containing protein [Teredinibacter franksiae]